MAGNRIGKTTDRFGLGWRPEMGLETLESLGEIDILEVVAESYAHLDSRELRAFMRLTSHVDIVVHALSLGLASTYPVSVKHLDSVARVVNSIEPEAWSEHLAFVRVPHRELGHLTAPPWSEETVEGAVRNVRTAARTVGSLPHLENIATLFVPPGSTMDEPAWTREIIAGAKTKLLIDLENIYANGRNLGHDWFRELERYPLDHVEYVHIAGGHERRDENGAYFLDDHMHPVSEEVFSLLEELAYRTVSPLTIILERDGNFPPFEEVKSELDRARTAVARGRERRRCERHAS